MLCTASLQRQHSSFTRPLLIQSKWTKLSSINEGCFPNLLLLLWKSFMYFTWGKIVFEGRSLKYAHPNEIPRTWTRQEQVLLLLELMLFHGQLELLQFLSPHLNMSILEAVPVWFHHCSPKTRGRQSEKKKNQIVYPPLSANTAPESFLLKKLNITLKKFNVHNKIGITFSPNIIRKFYISAYFAQASFSFPLHIFLCSFTN